MTTDPRTQHRPVDFDALHREALRLARCGLTPRDIGTLLGIGERAATTLLWPGEPAGGVLGSPAGIASMGDSDPLLGAVPAPPPTP